jgi:hypothetical protein
MKKINLLLVFCLVMLTFAQAQIPPQAFNYSAVARNASGQPIATTTIGIQVSILKTSPTGVSQYSENHFVNTDAFGLFNLVIGGGAVQSGSMTTIDWSNDNYYLKVGMDASGGTNFLTMGTTQLLSVPYALYAKSAGTVTNSTTSFFSIIGTGQLASSVSQKITLSSSITNIYNPNSYYNTTTDEYTIPLNGTYQFSISINGAETFVVKKNGVDQIVLPSGVSSTNCSFNLCAARNLIIPNLVAGDVISFWADGWADGGGPFTNFSGGILGYRID